MGTVENREASDLSKRIAGELEAAKIRATKLGKGWTWTSVERATGISHTTMQRMLAGKVDISVNRLMLICEAIGVPATTIIEEATRHLPDGYLQQLVASPNVSDAATNVNDVQSTDWNRHEGRKAADTDDEVNSHP